MQSTSVRVYGLLVSSCLGALGCAGQAGKRPADPPPNLILISVDTLRADRLNAYGYEARRVSPHIDGLAAEGILFERHMAASPWTTPSHLSLFTSLSPTAHGVTGTFSRLMNHLLGRGSFERLAEARQTLAEVLAGAGWATAAFTGGLAMDPGIGFDQGFDSYDTSLVKMSPKGMGRLRAWLDEPREGPFFLFWHTFEVHAPYLRTEFLSDVMPPDKVARVRRSLRRLAQSSGWKGTGEGAQILRRHGVYTRAVSEALYDGGVLSMDRWLGELLTALRERGLYDRTLIVLTSDHGEQLGEHSDSAGGGDDGLGFYNAHGHTLYEEMLRVPLIVKLPGQRHAGTRVSTVSRTIDVMPTILAELSLVPDVDEMQGVPLQPLWDGAGKPLPLVAFSESLMETWEKKGLTSERYKYVLSVGPASVREHGRAFLPAEPDAVELYDLRRDPGEKNNLLGPHSTAEANRLAALFEAELRRLSAERRGRAEAGQLAPETVEGLKALGYVQ